MAIKPKDIYEGTKKTHRAAKIIAVSLTLLVALTVGLFFWLRQFAVYDEDGNATLLPPFSQRSEESPQATPSESPEQSAEPSNSPGSNSAADPSGSPEEGSSPSPGQSPQQGGEDGSQESDPPEPSQTAQPE